MYNFIILQPNPYGVQTKRAPFPPLLLLRKGKGGGGGAASLNPSIR